MVDQHSTDNADKNFPKIKLSTLVVDLEVICESIVDFSNLKLNEFDLTGDVTTKG